MHIAVTVIGCGPTGLLLSGALAGRGHRRSPSTAGAQALVEDDPLRLRRLRMYSWQRLELDHTAPTTPCRRRSVARGPAARSRQLQPERGCPAGQPAAPGTVPRRPYSLQQVNPERGSRVSRAAHVGNADAAACVSPVAPRRRCNRGREPLTEPSGTAPRRPAGRSLDHPPHRPATPDRYRPPPVTVGPLSSFVDPMTAGMTAKLCQLGTR
jgi:hypothetical protein